jgi:tRNA pseudouridine55 synthase
LSLDGLPAMKSDMNGGPRGLSPPPSSPAGIVFLKKSSGMTSFFALGYLKRALHTKRIGHAGTLDRFAEGLMIAAYGPYTRLMPLFVGLDKRYRALFEFGKETSTLDPEGDVTAEAPLPSEEEIRARASGFTGSMRQRPPAFSAVHIDGKRAYSRALKGESFEVPERGITIYSFDILDWTPPYLDVDIRCSKGTYIRSLARDFALA